MISTDMLFPEIQEFGWDLSLMKLSYNWTKRRTKAEKFEKYLTMYIKLGWKHFSKCLS